MSNSTETPAVLGPVERQVRPYCWRAVGGSIWAHKTSGDDTPLYDQAALDAAVAGALERRREYDDALLAAERERCALICEGHIDAREQARAALQAAKALNEGTERNMIDRLSHEGVVHPYNRTLQRCADEIRKA